MKKVVADKYRNIDFSRAKRGAVVQPSRKDEDLHSTRQRRSGIFRSP